MRVLARVLTLLSCVLALGVGVPSVASADPAGITARGTVTSSAPYLMPVDQAGEPFATRLTEDNERENATKRALPVLMG